jgi:hypothetical protein
MAKRTLFTVTTLEDTGFHRDLGLGGGITLPITTDDFDVEPRVFGETSLLSLVLQQKRPEHNLLRNQTLWYSLPRLHILHRCIDTGPTKQVVGGSLQAADTLIGPHGSVGHPPRDGFPFPPSNMNPTQAR